MPKTKTTKPVATKFADLVINPKEFAALTVLLDAGRRGATNGDMAHVFESGRGKAKDWKQAHSWARNCVRRLVAEQLIVRIDRGAFRLTPRGRKFIADVEFVPSRVEWRHAS